MKKIGTLILLCLCCWLQLDAVFYAGTSQIDITPPLGTPSAGYAKREGKGILKIHDPLLATVVVIQTDTKLIALCGVDHLGFDSRMVQILTNRVHQEPNLTNCQIYLGSSHTHCGGGAFFDIPVLGEQLAGKYDPEILASYLEKTARAIIKAASNLRPAKCGIGYGKLEHWNCYRGTWPEEAFPPSDVTVIKLTTLEDLPLAAVFQYAAHPTVLKEECWEFSADFVGFARQELKNLLDHNLQPIFFNGAQGDVLPVVLNDESEIAHCESMGKALAVEVEHIWKATKTNAYLTIDTWQDAYLLQVQPNSQGWKPPFENYQTEVNLLVLNQEHAIVTIPGELSCYYDSAIKSMGQEIGFEHVSVFGLINDAHGYIIPPKAWQQASYESTLSFGGQNYGEIVKEKVISLMLQAREYQNPPN